MNLYSCCEFLLLLIFFFTKQTQNIQKICHKVVEVTEQECPELVPEARLVEDKYKQLLTMFGQCHFKFNSSSPMEEPEITVLGKYINGFGGEK